VLDISSVDGRDLVECDLRATFLDEFRIMFSIADRTGDHNELVLFDTLLPQDHPRNLRRVCPPLIYHDWVPFVGVRETSWGALNQHGSLITDPTQAIRVVDFHHDDRHRHARLAFRTQALIERACSPSTDRDIPWDEWGRGSVALEVSISGGLRTLVQGLCVITVKQCAVPGSHRSQLRLCIFDFRLRACGTLSDIGEGGESVRAARHGDRRDLFLEGSEEMDESFFETLGDGIFFYPVSHLCSWKNL
jgi:hypothetical protein